MMMTTIRPLKFKLNGTLRFKGDIQKKAKAHSLSHLQPIPADNVKHTDCEMRHFDVMKERHIKKLQEGGVKSHRERVNGFNMSLSKGPEYNDIPKVSKGVQISTTGLSAGLLLSRGAWPHDSLRMPRWCAGN